MKRIARLLGVTLGLAVLGFVVSLAPQKTASGTVAANVNVVNTPANPVPVSAQRNLQQEGTFFNVGPGGSSDLVVPAGVVLTDAHVSFSVSEAIPNAAALFVEDGSGKVLVYQIVNNTTFEAGINLGSGILSTGFGMKVQMGCYNITGNHCEGAIMWSGYTP
jgi:hypothetical protein